MATEVSLDQTATKPEPADWTVLPGSAAVLPKQWAVQYMCWYTGQVQGVHGLSGVRPSRRLSSSVAALEVAQHGGPHQSLLVPCRFVKRAVAEIPQTWRSILEGGCRAG